MQNNFNDIEPQTSFEAAWQQLKPKLDAEEQRRKRKKRVVFFWFTLLCAVGIGGATFYALQSANPQQNIAKTTTNTKVALPQQNNDSQVKVQSTNKTLDVVTSLKVKGNAKALVPNNAKSTAIVQNNNAQYSAIHHQTIIKNRNTNAKNISTTNIIDNNISGIVFNKQNIASTPNSNHAASRAATVNSNMDIDKMLSPSSVKKTTELPVHNKYNPTAKAVAQQPEKINEEKKTTTQTATKITKPSTHNNLFSYGLIFNYPISAGNNFYDVNGSSQLATMLIPTVFVNRQIAKKHSISLQLNPYAQYTINNKALLQTNTYKIKINSTDVKEDIVYTESISFNKLFGFELGLLYHYQLTNKLTVGCGVSNTWLQAALLQNKVTRNYTQVTKDSIYAANNSINYSTNLWLAKLQAEYNFKNIAIGISISNPLNNVFNRVGVLSKMPINSNLYVRCKLY